MALELELRESLFWSFEHLLMRPPLTGLLDQSLTLHHHPHAPHSYSDRVHSPMRQHEDSSPRNPSRRYYTTGSICAPGTATFTGPN